MPKNLLRASMRSLVIRKIQRPPVNRINYLSAGKHKCANKLSPRLLT